MSKNEEVGFASAHPDSPEPCMLDHNCADDEMCSCWCELHDCPLDNCPSYKLVTAWVAQAHTQGRKDAARDIRAYALERYHPRSGRHAPFEVAARIATGETTAIGTAGGGQPNASDLQAVDRPEARDAV